MDSPPLCPICGRALAGAAARAFCPNCLLKGALAVDASLDTTEERVGESLANALAEPGTTLVPATEEGVPAGEHQPGSVPPAPTETLSLGGVIPTVTFTPSRTGSTPETSGFPTIPGYDIERRLGRGGMGVVYKAFQRALKRPVALKMIRADLDVEPSQLERFRVEAEAVARLRHPNVVQIYEVGEVGGVPYFSLEVLEGGTLAERLAGAAMTARQAAELARTLARAIGAVHRVGIIHRDLKPANVLFDSDGTPKVTDFGLAKRLEVEDGQTMSGQVMGTPCYMAPEQAQGLTSQIGTAADIYALGAMLYETLTARPPFKGPSAMETVAQVIFGEPVPPSRLQPRVPRDLETICLKCLQKDPARRYATAADLADDLERFLAGESILARPTPVVERAAKWARRRPTAAALIAVGLVVALGLAVAAQQYAAYQRLQVDRVARLRYQGGDDLYKALGQRGKGLLTEARLTLNTLLAKLGTEPEVADLRDRARTELSDVDGRLAAANRAAADRARFDRFARLRDEALLLDGKAAIFPDAVFHPDAAETAAEAPAPDPRAETPVAKIRATAGAALDVFPLGAGGLPEPLPAVLTAAEQAGVESDRVLMLVVLSGAVAHPLAGEDPRRQAEEALKLLDRAATARGARPAIHLRRADCLERLGDVAAARGERARAAGLAPADAFDHLLLGREANLRGAWYEARMQLEEAVRLEHDSFWARCLLAAAELNSTPPRAAEAKTELTACLDKQPSYAWLHLLRGTAYGEMGVMLAAAGRGPQAANLADEAQQRFANAESDFRAALAMGLEERLNYVLHTNRGVMRFQRGDWAAAADDFTQAIAIDQGRSSAYASLAQALRKLGRPDEAIAQLDRAIEREPTLAALYRGRAEARLDGGDRAPAELEAALGDLETSARLEPRRGRAAADHARRGRTLLELDRPGDALAAADLALTIAADATAAQLVRIRALLILERYGDAVDACEAALAHGAALAELHQLRGLARAGREDYAGAVEDYTLALARHPANTADIHRDRGWSHLFAGALELALADFEAVLRLDPADPQGHAGRAAARIRLNRVREALADAEESLTSDGREPSSRLLYIAAQTYAQASVRSLAAVARVGRPATRESLAYEARATELLRQALQQTPAERRPAFWRDVIQRDVLLRPLLNNPRILRGLQQASDQGPVSRRSDEFRR